jgi:hypothetical protein
VFVIRESLRVIGSLLGYGFGGRRIGLVVLLVVVLVAVGLSGAATVTVPLALYPFL